MVRVTIELLPGGYEDNKRHLGTIEIANDATGNLKIGNYKAKLSRRGNPNSTWKTTEIKDFPRLQRGAYDLLYQILENVVGERNKPKSQTKKKTHSGPNGSQD